MLGISIVVPVYRNSDTLRELHRRLVDALENRWGRFEIVFVNDACPEGSGMVLEQLASRDSRVRVISHARNTGQQQALLDGIAASSGSVIVTLDADLQDPPEVVPRLVEQAATGRWSAVFAGRRGAYQQGFRMLTSRCYRGVVAWLTGLPSDAGVFAAFPRSTAEKMLSFQVRRPYTTIMIGVVGGPFLSIPVERDRRPSGSSSYSESMRVRAAVRAICLAVRLHRHTAAL